jgi:multiple sugar transport system ATP-binding protein
MRAGVLQQVGPPQELYDDPNNLFVAGFIGSPAMNFMPVTVEGEQARLPMIDIRIPDHVREAGSRGMIAGIRPEHFEDVGVMRDDDSREGARFSARVDRLEWLGSELFAHFDVEKEASRAGSGLADVADELQDAGVRAEHEALTVARIDPASDVAESDEATFWLDTTRIHYFDADSGENLVPRDQDVDLGEAERANSRVGASPA